MREYLWVIFWGIAATFLYNYFASLLRAVGNSLAPLLFLAVCALLNIALDLVFVLVFRWGVAGAAAATVLSQYVLGPGYRPLHLGALSPVPAPAGAAAASGWSSCGRSPSSPFSPLSSSR